MFQVTSSAFTEEENPALSVSEEGDILHTRLGINTDPSFLMDFDNYQ